MYVNGISCVRQKGGMLTMSDVAYARQHRRIRAREARSKLKRTLAQLEALVTRDLIQDSIGKHEG